ncbi:MAG TPA: diversity-generating retroelement protein Avd [Planctomycetaceae bacterium]|nr:diversity-generating retroelement protein Avd [Planctomycetaceae bacterium]HQZ65499.1 diversity-generating retroelement protein Avd [Planctomycetaceae bacterium]
MAKRKAEELIVITKAYDLILWSCKHISSFPRDHRFVLGERIERRLYDLLETLIEAKYSCSRTPLLQRANLQLEILRFQMRLAKDLQCLNRESYAFAAKSIDDIGEGSLLPASLPHFVGESNFARTDRTASPQSNIWIRSVLYNSCREPSYCTLNADGAGLRK